MALPSQPEILTLGCRLNIGESETIRAMLAGDIVVVNSCAVTNAAVKQTRAAIRRVRRRRPSAELVVTGCAAEIDRTGFAAMPEVTRVVGNLDKLSPRHWPGGHAILPPARARAFVAVQNGCDHSCTFCAIPAGRGTSRSIAIDPVLARIAALVDAGHREVVLTGVDLTSFGHDLPGEPPLGALVATILREVPGLARLRLSSLDAVEVDPLLFEIVTGEDRVMPHLHLSLQAGDDLVLKRMKRRHSRADAVQTVAALKHRRPDIAIGADLIAGFPTETAAMFANTLALIDDCEIVHAHVFPYSPRAGTPAARMPQVHPEVARTRAALLREAAGRRHRGWLTSLVGTVQPVLVERPGDVGYTPAFARVRLDLPAAPGSVVTAAIAGHDGELLHASRATDEA